MRFLEPPTFGGILGGISSNKNCNIWSYLLNVVLSYGANEFATEEERNPPSGAENLSFKSQLMHMLVHHSQVPVTSSVIIAIIVFLSVLLAKVCCNKFLKKKE